MKGYIGVILLFLIACSDVRKESGSLEGTILLEGRADQRYGEVGLTDSYLILLDRESDTIIQVFRKDDLSRLHAFALKGYGGAYFSSPEFVRSNTKDTTGKDEFWIVDNQLTFNRVRITADSLCFDRKYIPAYELVPSTYYNITSEEIYAVPIVEKDVFGPFCYANEEEGAYWVDPPKGEKAYRLCEPIAYLPNLCVNERQNSVVAALRFFNRIDFYDLKGTYQRSVTYGEEPIAPLLAADGRKVDVLGSVKCFIDSFGTNRYVYCLYDGSEDFSNAFTVLVLTWDGRLKKTLRLDRNVRRIAVDAHDRFIVGLSPDENGIYDVIRYELE